MDIDVAGRVKNTQLAYSSCLVPLHEAIINSIHAIEDMGLKDGVIDVFIDRDPNRLFKKDEEAGYADIVGFRVHDNGVGFTDENYRSFDTADSTLKTDRGGKGIGRFVWLKAFQRAEIDSYYLRDGECWHRRFAFVPSRSGIENESSEKASTTQRWTEVRLVGFRRKYQEHCPTKASTIARQIVEHCLEYFALGAAPNIILHDDAEEEPLDLNGLFADDMQAGSQAETFDVRGNELRLTSVMVYAKHDMQHTINYCAHKRVVVSENLARHIPNLQGNLRGEQDRPFFYAAYVGGDVLDDTVSAERTGFLITRDGELDFGSALTWPELTEAAVGRARQFLSKYTDPINEEKMRRIQAYVETEAPQYRPLLKHKREALEQIPPDLADDKLELELHRVSREYEAELKERGRQLMDEDEEDLKDLEEHKEKYDRFWEEWNELGMSNLARYVAHRRAVIDFLERRLQLQDTGKYSLEESIHSIVFPLRTTSDDVDYEAQNLWLVDERLEYHRFLASDRPISTYPVVDASSRKEPDIVIFNKSMAFVESDTPYHSVVLIEFKRPLRDDYGEDENPITQVYGYIRDITEGRAKTREGRPVEVHRNASFYCFVVCDITPTLIKQAEDHGFKRTPDGRGFFGYNENLSAYTEVISFNKLVADARKRNRVLFDKLNMPTS